MRINNHQIRLIASLQLLAQDYEKQKKLFPKFVDIPFEILDTFEKSFQMLPILLENKIMDCEVVPSILNLHNLVNLELKNPNFDLEEAEVLCNSKSWQNLRLMAKNILIQLNEPIEIPNVKYL